MIPKNATLSPKILIWIPVLVYLLSYAYLAYYHQKLWLFNTVVHEGGTLTFLENLFYASHFLGHIPVHVTLALVFTGSYLSFAPPHSPGAPRDSSGLYSALAAFLLFLICLSFVMFGSEDTLAFILQRKQGVATYETGGSWNLHLPSTLLLIPLIPCYVGFARCFFGKPVHPNSQGLPFLGSGILLILTMTWLLNDHNLCPLWELWTNPRYMAHSVRELATFPLTYFPLPLYFLFKNEKNEREENSPIPNKTKALLFVPALLFLLGFSYQVAFSLSHGIENLAHKPPFAQGGRLSVTYLLTSHYFEHFLDTLFFTLVCLILARLGSPRQAHANQNQPMTIQKSSSHNA